MLIRLTTLSNLHGMWWKEESHGSNGGARTNRTFGSMALRNRLPARFTLAHGLMILAGLMTFVLVNGALADKREMATVVVASAQAEAGRSMTPELVELPASTPGLEYFATVENLQGKVLARPIPEGQPIMKDDLVDAGSLDFRTFALPVDSYQIEGLRLSRNDRVDVVGFDETGTPTYLASDLVVVGTSSTSVEGLGSVRDSYITVQVDDLQALALSQGQRNGPLHVVRSTGAAPVVAVGATGTLPPADESAEGDRP